MKKINYFLGFFVLLDLILFSQNEDTIQFQTLRNYFLNNQVFDTTENEGGALEDIKRWELVWNSRLSRKSTLQDVKNAYLNYFTGNTTMVANNSNWQPLGPFVEPVPKYYGVGLGRVNCIAIHPFNPNILYVGSPYGGVWKSTDAGLSWVNLNTDHQLPTLQISAIAIDPLNPNFIYIATGDKDDYTFTTPCFGIYRSSDGGNTWAPVNNGLNLPFFAQIGNILIHPNNPDVVFISTSVGIYKTTNARSACIWQAINDVDVQGKYFFKVVFKPDGNYSTLYASGYDIIKSIDGGNTWFSITGGGTGLEYFNLTSNNSCPPNVMNVPIPVKIDIAVTPANPHILYASLIMSNQNPPLQWDSKRTQFLYKYNESYTPSWVLLSSFKDKAGVYCGDIYEAFNVIEVSPIDENFITLGNVIIFKSTDGGNTIKPLLHSNASSEYFSGIYHPDIHYLKFSDDGLTLYACTDGGLYKIISPFQSSNNVTFISNNLSVGTVYRLSSEGDYVLMGELDCGSNALNLNNNVWYQIGSGDGAEQIIDPKNYNTMYSSCQKICVSKSNNGINGFLTNNTMPIICNTSECNSEFIMPYSLSPVKSDELYLGLINLYKYNVSNSSWLKLSNFANDFNITLWAIHNFAVCKSNPNFIYVIADVGNNNPSFFKTTIGGYEYCTNNCWSVINHPENLELNCVLVHPSNPNVVWIGYKDYISNKRVYKSYDGGVTWQNISMGLPPFPVNDIVYEEGSDDGIYVATDVGVFYRNNKMNSWIPFKNNLPNAKVTDLEINYAQNKIYAATFGRGVWASDLYCPPDYDINIHSANYTQYNHQFNEAENNIYITTSGSSYVLNNFTARAGNEIVITPTANDEIILDGTGNGTHLFIHPCNHPGNSFRQSVTSKRSTDDYPVVPEMINGSMMKSISGLDEKHNHIAYLYPNPTDEHVHIDVKDNAIIEKILLKDISGKIVLQKESNTSSETIDISHLSDGLYFVVVQTTAGTYTEKLIVRHE